MPTYQYACTVCDHGFEVVQAFTDEALTECPECQGRLRKVYGSVGVVFKGSGFYRTDSREKPKSDTADKADKAKSDGKSDETKTDSKPKSDSTPSSTSGSGTAASNGSSGSSATKTASTAGSAA